MFRNAVLAPGALMLVTMAASGCSESAQNVVSSNVAEPTAACIENGATIIDGNGVSVVGGNEGGC